MTKGLVPPHRYEGPDPHLYEAMFPPVCEHGIRAPWQCDDCDEANPPPEQWMEEMRLHREGECDPRQCPICGEAA